MKMIDIHSHWGTKRGYVLRTDEELAQQKKTWNSEPKYATEDQMADHFRQSKVCASCAAALRTRPGSSGSRCRGPAVGRPAIPRGSRSTSCASRRIFPR